MYLPVYRNVAKVDEAWWKKYGHHSKQSAAEVATAVCLKQHKTPHSAIHSVVCWERGEVERWKENVAYVEGIDNEYGACNGVKGSHDTVVAVAAR